MGNVAGIEALDFMRLGLLAVNASDELKPFGTPATRVRRSKDGSNWSAMGRVLGEVTAVGVSGTGSENIYSYKTVLKLGGKFRILGAKIFL